MQKLTIHLIILLVLLNSCKKESASAFQASTLEGQWKWTIQYYNNPAYYSTPQTTGINEILSFLSDGSYLVSTNTVVTNTGTYKTSTSISSRGELVPTLHFSNNRITDSVVYFKIQNNLDTLIFCHDFIGTVGSGSRYYEKIH